MIKSVVPKYSTLSHNHLLPSRKEAWHVQGFHMLSPGVTTQVLWHAGANSEIIDKQVGASKVPLSNLFHAKNWKWKLLGLWDCLTGWRRRRVLSAWHLQGTVWMWCKVMDGDLGPGLSNGSLHPGAAVGTLLIAGHLQRHVGKCVEVSYNGAGQIRQNHPKSTWRYLYYVGWPKKNTQSHHVIPSCITTARTLWS